MGSVLKILTVNAGSSSIKLDVLSFEDSALSDQRSLTASITGIGQTTTTLTVHKPPETKQSHTIDAPDYPSAISGLMNLLSEKFPVGDISAIGHRIVHGGPNYSQPAYLSDEVMADLEAFSSFDPEHAPNAHQLIYALRQQYPGVPQVACFDTAFFHDLPAIAQALPLPHKYQAEGLRRYGFHGLSYSYLQSAFRDSAGELAVNGKVIYAHLGSGASLAATLNGQPVETTMGFSPTSGIMMSARSGDLDPSIVSYLNHQTGQTLDDYNHMINFESGLLGVSELSADMYTLLQRQAENQQADLAVKLFVYQVRKAIGSLTAVLGGLDSLIFSGGIGEQSPVIRQQICDGLDYLGIKLNDVTNQAQADLISDSSSKVGVHVIPTDEASVIAQQVFATINTSQT